MSLEQGVRYNIVAGESAKLRTVNYVRDFADDGVEPKPSDTGLVKLYGSNAGLGIAARQIDYILEAKDSNGDFVPNASLSSDLLRLLNSKTLTQFTPTRPLSEAGHDGISFFVAITKIRTISGFVQFLDR